MPIGASKFRTMRSNVKQIAQRFPELVGKAQMAETEIEVKECQKECPVESGTMRDEIHAEGPEYSGKTIRTSISTGPKSAEYALIQHEDLELFHKQGGPKFIERPLRESAPHMMDRIAARIDLDKAR